jgi:hypothetical protein
MTVNAPASPASTTLPASPTSNRSTGPGRTVYSAELPRGVSGEPSHTETLSRGQDSRLASLGINSTGVGPLSTAYTGIAFEHSVTRMTEWIAEEGLPY